jgi:hypothetical protein
MKYIIMYYILNTIIAIIMSMMKFMNNRKKDNRQSLLADNLDLEKLENYSVSSSLSEHNDELYSIYKTDSYDEKYIYDEKNTYDKEEIYNKKVSTINKVHNEGHTCNLCHNKNNIKDVFMILACGHIFHIRCLVDNHYTDSNKYGIIDKEYFNSRCCLVCNSQMEMEDILYIHNKFYKNTKEYLVKQEDNINILDKKMTKLKEELRICYEYKQRLEHQREKSKQITITINTLM